MENRKLLNFGALVILTAVVVYLILNSYQKDKTPQTSPVPIDQEKTSTQILTGEVTEVNLDQIAFDGPAIVTFTTTTGEMHRIALPSMGRMLCTAKDTMTEAEKIAVGDNIEVLGIKNENGEIVPCEDESHYLKVNSLLSDKQTKIEFPYRVGPNGYIMQTNHMQMSDNNDFVSGYEFMLWSDYLEMQNVTIPREGPPTITLRTYKNMDKLLPTIWAERNPLDSNINLIFGEKIETSFGDNKAIRYTVNGLYNYDTYIITHNDYVYVFSAAYIDENSPMPKDLQTMIAELKFIE